ncbi:MAG TPA: universal stress protein [Jatrophihabitans sp.]|nr:universal stress protein [Jatrophihabitans sp.]
MPAKYEIVAAVDGSRASRAAVMWAAREAERRNSGLFVVYVCEYGNASLWPSPDLEKELRAFVRPTVDEAITLAQQTAPSITVTGSVMMGPITRMLVGITEQAELMVLGRSGKGALARHLVGSLTTRLAAHAHCPVIVVPIDGESQPADGSAGKVVVGIGDRPTAGAALRFAIAEAELRHTAAMPVHAWHGPEGLPVDPDAQPPHPMYVEDAELRQANGRIAAALPEVPAELRPQSVVRAGQPAGVLLSLCHPADLLVLGQHRHEAAFTPTTVGRVIGECLQHAVGPVAVVPEPALAAAKGEPPRVAEAAGLIAY